MVNKYLSRIFVFVLLVFIFIGCQNGGRSMFLQENGIEFDTLAYKKTYFLDNNMDNPSCNLTIRFVYPRKSTKTDLSNLQHLFVVKFFGMRYDSLRPHEAIEKYTRNYIDNYINDAKDFNSQAVGLKEFEEVAPPENPISKSDTETNHFEQFYSYHESLSDTILFNEKGILSFQIRQVIRKGQNTTFETFYCYVINLKTGKLIAESDIFKPGYDMALQKIITNALLTQNNVRTVLDLEDLGYFGINEILPNTNFFIDDKGITYIFNKGEYSAYQIDAPKVFLSYEALRPILKSNTLLSNLVN